MQASQPKTVNWVILLLASITAVTPLAIDMYLPAFLAISESLDAEISLVQVSLSCYLAGFALSMLMFGPIADIVGRRPLALWGLCLFILFSTAIVFVRQIEWFLVLRTLQAMAGGAAAVVVPGIVRHLYGQNTAKGMSYVSMIMMIAPLIAPSVGSLILQWFDWRVIFAVLACYALLLWLPAFRWLPEVATRTQHGPWLKLFFSGYVTVLGNRAAQPHIAISMLVSFAFFGYLTAVPVVYMEAFGVSEQLFGILFASNVAALMMVNFVNTRLVVRLGSERMLTIGLVLGLSAAASLLTVNLLGLGLAFTVISIIPLIGSLGLMAVNADSLILIRFPHHSGTATAVIGSLRFGSGALVGPVLALTYTGTAVPFATLMFCALVVVLLTKVITRGRVDTTDDEINALDKKVN
ncbi:multidrug effflux MFS transporter [Lacimicrobium alkaliphilum]|uniref:Bcr/CflA family efflux transporter n=1 Tax=Lacimicrobium alkaliphilum TaxID=1526571 RepID=A0A0U2PK14_9ALTE|nr:multidrug effflux MFS transporter [Lacimicrobium alkaliphilum]ALS99917.1 MFS transporter [Lacimicrobium alkaliphilum]